MGAELTKLSQSLQQFACDFDASVLHGSDALGLLGVATEIESMACALKLSLSRRVEQTNQHQGLGYASASDLVAARTGVTEAAASSSLATARQLQELPTARAEFSSGKLSCSQAAEVARGAAADPSAEGALLNKAHSDSNEALRRERVRLEKVPSLVSRRRQRKFCSRPGQVGMTDFWGTLPNEEFASLKAELDLRAKRFFLKGRKTGSHELQSAYLADALVDMALGDSSKKRVNINVVVDHPVLDGVEGRCEIPGVGPISPETVKAWSNDCWLNVLLRKGKDITAIASERRYVPVDVRRALGLREPVCSVRGCENSVGLQRDHRNEMRDGGLTAVGNLAYLCPYHHKLKTHDGFRLVGEIGDYVLVPPSKGDATEQAKLFPPGAA